MLKQLPNAQVEPAGDEVVMSAMKESAALGSLQVAVLRLDPADPSGLAVDNGTPAADSVASDADK